MENVTRTLYGQMLQTAQFSNLPFDLIPNTTLNEKFGVQAGVAPASTPSVGYYCIGNGGHSLQSGAQGIALIKTLQHSSLDAALFKHLPFVLRATNNDLTVDERRKYALRTAVTYNSTNYFAYYLKRIDMTGAAVAMKLQTNNNGSITTSTFVPTSANLDPTPAQLSTNGVNSLQGQYGLVSATLGLALTAAECQEILNAATIIYGDPAYAIISEIGLCSGVDKIVSLASGGQFNEVVACQIASHVSTMHVLQDSSTGVGGTLQIGAAEPLLVIA